MYLIDLLIADSWDSYNCMLVRQSIAVLKIRSSVAMHTYP